MNKDDLINDIVTMLDQSVTKGTGHLNITVDVNETENMKKNVSTLGCPDCSAGNLACNTPTLHEGMDSQPDKN